MTDSMKEDQRRESTLMVHQMKTVMTTTTMMMKMRLEGKGWESFKHSLRREEEG